MHPRLHIPVFEVDISDKKDNEVDKHISGNEFFSSL